jgi:phospholipid transport system substrate-binding protein
MVAGRSGALLPVRRREYAAAPHAGMAVALAFAASRGNRAAPVSPNIDNRTPARALTPGRRCIQPIHQEKHVKRLIGLGLAAFVALAFLFATPAPALAAAADSPEALVRSTADEVLAVIRTTKDKKTLRELAEQKVLPYFDFRAMTQLAVGRYWREATPQQQKALTDSFKTLLINTYTASLNVAASGKESVDIKPTDVKGNDTVVRTIVRIPNRQPIPVDYRMTKGADGWKVYDVIVENLSLVTNYRSSFATEIQKSGIDGLVKALETKNRELAQNG